MPSLSVARRVANAKNNNAKTIGQIYKEQSDFIMEETWENDIESKVCYIYDYFHDDMPDKNIGMTYDNTTKTRIDAKFIIKSYQSIDKDQVEYYIQFRPSQKIVFDEKDELYYFESDYRQKYRVQDFPIGMMIDIPDDTGTYRKWLICSKEQANQFVKYLVLPCDYYLRWIERDGQQRYKRAMWCVQRQQNSYTIGVYRDRYLEHPDNQTKLWLPLNSITDKFWYNDEISKTMRLIVSAPTENPIVWSVTKIENSKPIGIQKLTLYQDFWDENTDYIERDENGKIVAIYADYYDSQITPIDPDIPKPIPSSTYGTITASSSSIKVGGSYKTLTLKLFDIDDNEVTENYSDAIIEWTCEIDGVDQDEMDVLLGKISIVNGTAFNKVKIKFPDERKYLEKILTVKCTIFDESKGYTFVSSEFELNI